VELNVQEYMGNIVKMIFTLGYIRNESLNKILNQSFKKKST